MNNKHLKLVLAFILLVCFQNSTLHAQLEKDLSPKKMQKDLDKLKKIIEAHPDPYTHISEKDFNAEFEKVKASLDEPHTVPEYFKKAAALVALFKDGHSSVRLPLKWLEKQQKKNGAFPYEFHLTNDDKLYAIKNHNESKVPAGAQILKINGISVDSFLNFIDPCISYELKPFRNTRIDNNFEKYLYLAFGYSDNTSLEYTMAETATVQIKNMPFREWKKVQKGDRENREIKIERGEPYEYKKISEGVGLINIYAFSVGNSKDYGVFLHNTFKKIRKDEIHSLIIDIRGNYGGWPKIASQLFHYISDTYFKTMAQSSMKVSYPYRNNLFDRVPYLKNNRPYIRERRHYVDIMAVVGDPIGSYVNEDAFFNEPPITAKYEFRGDCYLLTNRDSYSAASSFASTFSCYQMGAIIGEVTGGTKIFRANAIYEELPKTELRVSMSTTKLYTACFNNELEGVKPTVDYSPSIFEIVADLDTQLIFTQRFIKKVQKIRKENEGEAKGE